MTHGEDGEAEASASSPSIWARPPEPPPPVEPPAPSEPPTPSALISPPPAPIERPRWGRPAEAPEPEGPRPLVEPYRPEMLLPPQPSLRSPLPPVEPPRRSRVRRRAVLLVGVVLALLVPVAALARTATAPAKASASVSAVSDSPSASASPSHEPTAEERIEAALDAQGKALLTGDLAGYLAAIEPSDGALREAFTRRFGSLRALQVSTWEQRYGVAAPGVGDLWAMQVTVQYCFVTPDCVRVPMQYSTHWEVSGSQLWLRKFDNVDDDEVRPWDVSDLRVSVGRRVILATTARYAARLPAMIGAADKAADVADRFAKWNPPPGRYLVLLAGPDEWAKWYSGETSKWVAGYARKVSRDVADVVLNANRVDNADTGYVLRHELTHVTTLIGARTAGNWWLVEGIAEYARVVGGGTAFDGLADVRRYVRSGRWSGSVALTAPGPDTAASEVRGHYGIAYLAVRRIADRFGEAKMLEFFSVAERRGYSLQLAATEALGAEWDAVAADCAQYVRSRI